MTTRDEELALITRAQAGDQSATRDLWDQYRPLILKTVGKVARARKLQKMDREDLQADLVVVLLETIQSFDVTKGYGLASVLPQQFAGVTNRLNTTIQIPRSTLNRFWAIMKAADGDVNAAAALAPVMGPGENISTELFWEVHNALRVGTPEVAELAPWTGGVRDEAPNTDQYREAHLALSVLTEKEREVVEWAFGFRDHEGHSDAYVADILGKSPSVVRNTRLRALDKMRAAVELARETEEVIA